MGAPKNNRKTLLVCPNCKHAGYIRNGKDARGKRRYICTNRSCRISYVETKAIRMVIPVCDCGNTQLMKNGRPNGNQRFWCDDCEKNFTIHTRRSVITPSFKRNVVNEYRDSLGKGELISARRLAKMFDINHVTVTQWIKEVKKEIAERERLRIARLNGRPERNERLL